MMILSLTHSQPYILSLTLTVPPLQLLHALAAVIAARRLDKALAQSRMAPATTVTVKTADGSLALQERSVSLSLPSAQSRVMTM